MRYVVLDTETTGLNVDDGHRVIEIGCVEIENRSLTGREYHQKINPVREVDKGAEEIHGMNAAQLRIYPKFEGIVEEFIEFNLETMLKESFSESFTVCFFPGKNIFGYCNL